MIGIPEAAIAIVVLVCATILISQYLSERNKRKKIALKHRQEMEQEMIAEAERETELETESEDAH